MLHYVSIVTASKASAMTPIPHTPTFLPPPVTVATVPPLELPLPVALAVQPTVPFPVFCGVWHRTGRRGGRAGL